MNESAEGEGVRDRGDFMQLSDVLIEEFEPEVRGTRKTLQRVPEDRLAWSPHPKSPTMGWLAAHLANIPSWAAMTIEGDSLDLAPGGERMDPVPPPETTAELVATFDRNAEEARTVIRGARNEDLLGSWSLLRNGQLLMTMPRLAVLRSFVYNHLVHHRAQLGVYLRLNDIPVPAIYGPSADENPFGP